MHIKFIEAKYNDKIELTKKCIQKLPKKIGLITTVQFVDALKEVKKILEQHNKICFIGNTKQKHKGQILGCDISAAVAVQKKVDAFLYIGTGEFHPMKVSFETDKPVFVFNPDTSAIEKFSIDKKRIEAKKRGAYIKFLSSMHIGILVSTKPGQNHFKEAITLKKRLVKQGKKAYILVADTLDYSSLENFIFVDCFVNTMCPRITSDDYYRFSKAIIDYTYLKKIFK
jgi:2-(3-amino-3-carboxypropyl)histidine synthase